MRKVLLLALLLAGGCGLRRAVTPEEVKMQKFKVTRRTIVVHETTVTAPSIDKVGEYLEMRGDKGWREVDRNVLETEVEPCDSP